MIRAISSTMAAAAALTLLAGCMPYSTGPTEVGVRTVKWSPLGKAGVDDTVYAPGSTYFFMPFLTDWHTFDTRLQNLEMTGAIGRGDRMLNDELVFKTIDGNDIRLDVIISYRVIPEQAPAILRNAATSDRELRENVVRTVARSKPRDLFGELRTEDFYVAEERTQKAEEVRQRLNEILGDYGVTVERVGTRDYRFNPEYQKAIEEKKVADQEAEKLKSETRAKEEEFNTKVEKALAEIEKTKAQADGEYERAKIEADAYYDQQREIAKAILAEGAAEAEGIQKMNEALSGPGGIDMVKLDIADALKNKRIVMIPTGGGGLDVRTTDINQLLQLYGLKGLSEK